MEKNSASGTAHGTYTNNMNDQGTTEPTPQPATTPADIKKQEIVADKQVRVDLDETLQQLKKLAPSRERALAITKTQEAIMWLGMDLKRIGAINPYPESYNPSNDIVAPTADGLKL